MIILPAMLTTFAVEVANALKTQPTLSVEKANEIASFLSSEGITEVIPAYDKLNGISYETVTTPAVTSSRQVFIADLRPWWRAKLFAIENPDLFALWKTQSSEMLSFYNEGEQILRDSVMVDGVETNTFISFKNQALNTGVITEADLDELFQTTIRPEATIQRPYREIDRIMGSEGNVISLRDLEVILEVGE